MHITRLATQAMCRAFANRKIPPPRGLFHRSSLLGSARRKLLPRRIRPLPTSASSELVLLPGRERSPRPLIVLGVSRRLGRGQDLNGDPITAEKGGERPDPLEASSRRFLDGRVERRQH